MADRTRAWALLSIVFGVALYVGAVAGLWTDRPVPAGDIGLTSTSALFLLLGIGGMAVSRSRAPRAA